MNGKMRLFFPCDFEDESDKRNSKLKEVGFCNVKQSKRNCEDGHTSMVIADEQRYSSPIFEVNSPDQIQACKKVGIETQKDIAQKVFESCLKETCFNLETYQLLNDCYLEKIYYPYGICVSCEGDKDFSAIANFVYEYFQPFKQSANDKDKDYKKEWIIYDRPLIVVENVDCNVTNDSKPYKFKNDILYVNSTHTPDNDFDAVYAVVTALKQISSYVRLWTKNINHLSGSKQNKVIGRIHSRCAVFEEIRFKTIFINEIEKKLFDYIYEEIDVKALQKQTESAKDYADYIVVDITNTEAQNINRTVFITGYIGLILSFLSFIPIQLKNIVWVDHKLDTFEKISLFIAAVGSIIVLAGLFIWIYKNKEKVSKDFVAIKRYISRFFKWFSNKLVTVFVILLIVSTVCALIFLIIFAFKNNFIFV